jgi:hypothetical protein
LSLFLLDLLMAQAAGLQARANLALVEAVTSGKVKSPFVESLEAVGEKLAPGPAAKLAAAQAEAADKATATDK